jgi:hypothetical protein
MVQPARVPIISCVLPLCKQIPTAVMRAPDPWTQHETDPEGKHHCQPLTFWVGKLGRQDCLGCWPIPATILHQLCA